MKITTLLATLIVATMSFAQVPNYVPTTGLVGWWPFNGNANDESGNGNNGTVNGAVASLCPDRDGNLNSAYNFQNALGGITVNSFDFPEENYTVSAWVNVTLDPAAVSSKNIISHDWNNGGEMLLFLNEPTSQSVNFDCNPNTGNSISASVNSNEWNHLVMQRLGLIFRLYLNGVLIQEGNKASMPIIPNNNLFFGGDPVGSQYSLFNGKLDDICIWNRALTGCEIQDLFNSQLNTSIVYAGIDQTICNGDPVTLSASNSMNYSWDNGVADGVTFNPTATQDYTVSADSAGCLSTDVVTVTVNENTTATQTETALDSYTWPINAQTYTSSGMYTAVIPNAAGCDSTITLDLSLVFTGLEENSQGALFSVFPNPAQSIINVKADNKLIGDVYTIYDNTGRVVLTGKLNSQNTTIELNNLSGGIYMFSVGENMKQTFKVIKE